MKIKIRKTDRGREGEAVSPCPRDLNPTVDGPHRTGKPPSKIGKNRPRRGRCVLSVFSTLNRRSCMFRNTLNLILSSEKISRIL
jgi:hypothetical protein